MSTLNKIFTAAFAALVFTLSTAQTAKAVVPAPGEFIPSVCGVQSVLSENLAVKVAQVCIGQVAGDENQAALPAVGVRLTNGAIKIYQITKTSNLLIAFQSGETKSLFHLVSQDGEETVMHVIRGKNNAIQSASGQAAGIEFFVNSFKPVFVIQ